MVAYLTESQVTSEVFTFGRGKGVLLRLGLSTLCSYSSVSQQYKPLGMQNGRIPSRAITCSSQWDRYHGPSRARLKISQRGRYRGAWSARHNNPYQWIMVDFRRPVKVLAVATQGRADVSQWVTRYYLSYSFDGINSVPYMCRKVSRSGVFLKAVKAKFFSAPRCFKLGKPDIK